MPFKGRPLAAETRKVITAGCGQPALRNFTGDTPLVAETRKAIAAGCGQPALRSFMGDTPLVPDNHNHH